MADERESTLQKLLDVLFGEDDGTEVEAVVIVDSLAFGPNPDRYTAFLYGLEGEHVQTMIVAADEARNNRPPLTVCVAFAEPPLKAREVDGKAPTFRTVEYELREYTFEGFAMYLRRTPAWGDE